ncbi:hypothetical protein BT69DRAFT_1355020, partial [Atractiella rhizophila]
MDTLCLACSSTILPSSSSSSAPKSQHENPSHSSYTTPCCSRPICNRCLSRVKSLRFYCVRCQDVVRDTGHGDGEVDKEYEREKWSLGEGEEDESELDVEKVARGDFVIGEDSDDEDARTEVGDEVGGRWDADVITLSDPPAYSLPPSPPTSPPPPPTIDDGNLMNQDLKHLSYVDFKPRNLAGEPEVHMREKSGMEDRVSVHYIQPKETLRGIALKYGIDGHHLCVLNSLPPSTLSTTPALLHTRPFLLLPPNAQSSSPSPTHSEEIERTRLLIRRFQMATKVSEYALAKVYVEHVLAGRRKEARFVWRNRRNREVGLRMEEGDEEEEEGMEEFVRKGGELEEA